MGILPENGLFLYHPCLLRVGQLDSLLYMVPVMPYPDFFFYFYFSSDTCKQSHFSWPPAALLCASPPGLFLLQSVILHRSPLALPSHSTWSKAHIGLKGALKVKIHHGQQPYQASLFFTLHLSHLSLPPGPLQSMSNTWRWTAPFPVPFLLLWAAQPQSPARCFCPPHLPPPPPLHLGSSGQWCPAMWRLRSLCGGATGWR